MSLVLKHWEYLLIEMGTWLCSLIASGGAVCHYQAEMETGLPGSEILSFLSPKMIPSVYLRVIQDKHL